MGLGDELMVAGEARRMREENPERVRVINRRGRLRWQEVWNYCPDITRSQQRKVQECHNAPGKRPYIDYTRSTPQRWYWLPYEPTPARVVLPAPPIRTGRVLIEPNTKPSAPPAKQWGRWGHLVDLLGDQVEWVQIGPPGTKPLPGVKFIPTPNIATALRVVAGCRAAVVPEGGLHHACAAFGIPAVVLYGAYITPLSTGYAGQVPLWVDRKAAQGWRIAHRAATSAWKYITPQLVADELEKLLDETAQGRMASGQRAALN